MKPVVRPIWLTLLVLATGCSRVAVAFDNTAKDLFDLSLEQLMDLRIDGGAVRDLGLRQLVYLDNNGEFANFEIAASVDLIDKKTIDSRGLNNIVEVVDNMVGILAGESPSEPYSFSMRGFTRDSVKVLYDGISIGSATLNMRPLATYNLQQVEVIKGPVALQHGQGASAGSINFVSKKPDKNGAAYNTATASYGKYDSQSLGAEVHAPWQTGALRLDLYHRDSNGWVDNADFSSTDIHAALQLEMTEHWDITLSYSHLQDDLPAYWGTPLVPHGVAEKPSKAVTTQNNRVIDADLRFNNYNVHDHVIESRANWYRLESQWQIKQNLQNQTTFYYYDATRNWRNAETYRYDPNTEQVDRDRLLVDHERAVWGINSDFLWQQRLFNQLHRFTTSLEYSANQFDRNVGFDAVNFLVDSVALREPQSGTFGAVDVRPDRADQAVLALVLEDWVQVTDAFHLEAGLRQEQVDLDRRSFDFDGSVRSELDDRFDLTSYRLAAGYDFTHQVTAYLQYSLQHDNINTELASPLVEDLSAFEPSDTRQWEAGIKAELNDRRTQLSAAVFDIEKESPLLQNGINSTAQQQSTGVELAVANQFTDQFKLGFNIAYVDARYGNYFDPDYGRDVSGNTPVNVPDTMASVWATYSRFLQLPIELGAGMNYVSDRFADSSNQTTLESYQLFHAFAAYNVDNLRIMLQVHNVTDEIYVPWSDTIYPGQALLGAPRVYDLVVKTRF